MSGAVQSAVTVAGRGCVAALALALVLHGSTKRPPARQSAAPAPPEVTDADLARGYRLVSVATNAALSRKILSCCFFAAMYSSCRRMMR